MISEGGRHTASSDIWLTSLKKKKKKKIRFLLTKYLFMGFSTPLKRQNLERNRKKKKHKKAAKNCDSFAVECEQTISWKYGTGNNMMCFYYLTHKN